MLTPDTLKAFDILFTIATVLQAVPFHYDINAPVLKVVPVDRSRAEIGPAQSKSYPRRNSHLFQALVLCSQVIDISTFLLLSLVVTHFFFVPKPIEVILIQTTAYTLILTGFFIRWAMVWYQDEIVDLINKWRVISTELSELTMSTGQKTRQSKGTVPGPAATAHRVIPWSEIFEFLQPKIPKNGEEVFEQFFKLLLGLNILLPVAGFIVLSTPNSPFQYSLCTGSCQLLWRLIYAAASAITTFYNGVRVLCALCTMMAATFILHALAATLYESVPPAVVEAHPNTGSRNIGRIIHDYNALRVYFNIYRECISELMPLVSGQSAFVIIFAGSSLMVFHHVMPLSLKGPLLLVLGATVITIVFGFQLAQRITENTTEVLRILGRIPIRRPRRRHNHLHRQLQALHPIYTRCGSLFEIKHGTPLTILGFMLGNVGSAVITYKSYLV